MIYRNKRMKSKMFKSKKFYLGIIILIATSGSIFFFPMNLGEKYTCFYHRIFNHSHPVSDVNALNQHQDGKNNLSKSGDNNLSNGTSKQNNSETSQHGSVLLDNYLHQYAFPWWASVSLLALCIYLLLKIKRKVRTDESSLTMR
jgi:hypothetical protein